MLPSELIAMISPRDLTVETNLCLDVATGMSTFTTSTDVVDAIIFSVDFRCSHIHVSGQRYVCHQLTRVGDVVKEDFTLSTTIPACMCVHVGERCCSRVPDDPAVNVDKSAHRNIAVRRATDSKQ